MKRRERRNKLDFQWLVIGGLVLTDLVTKGWAVSNGWGWAAGKAQGWLWVGFVVLLLFLKDLDVIGRVFLVAGGAGNLIEKIMFDRITDWIELPLVGLWFNLADLWLTLGVVWIVISEIKNNAREACSSI